MLGHWHKIAGSKYGMGTEVAKCVLGQNSLSIVSIHSTEKRAVLAMGVTLQLNGV